MTATREAPAARLFMLVVAASVFLSTLTGSMVNVVIPAMRAELGASAAHVGWIVTAYALAYAVGVPLYGRISDVYGVRRVFVLGLLGFAAGGLLCAVAPTFPLLVAGRIVQGAGGAAIPALASVAVARVLPPGERGGALGLTSSAVGIGSSVGPIVGGIVGDALGWRALFVGSVALALLVAPVARRVLPDERAEGDPRFDLVGGALLGIGAGLFLFGITQGQAAGFGSASSWGSFAGAAVALAGFVARVRTAPHPFLSPALFRNGRYVAAMAVGFFTMLAVLTVLVFIPLLLVEANGLSPSAAGLVLTAEALALAILAPMSGRLSDRVGARPPIVAGLGLIALSLLVLSTLAGAPPLVIAAGVVGIGAGLALVQAPLNNAAAGSLPEDQLGGGMGLFSGAFFLGAGTGPALVGAFLAARQAAGADALNPLHGLGAAPFSDAFLAVAVAPLLALVAASGLPSRASAPADARPSRRGAPSARAPVARRR